MKKINAISLLFLLASAQMYGGVGSNTPMMFAFACHATNAFNDLITSDEDDRVAAQIIDFMNNCIQTDANLKQQLAASVNGYLFKGKPLDPVAIAEQDKKLQESIKKYNHNIKKEKGSNNTLALANKKKLKKKEDSRNDKQKKLQANLAALQENKNAENAAKAHADMIQNLIEQNQLSLDQAIEYYIATFGQCYTLPGSVYGSSIIISSYVNKNVPITPKKYSDFLKSLNQAASQFGSTISIQLALGDNGVDATIKEVASYVNNMAPSSTSYSTYALVGLGTAAAIVGAMAYNINSQGKDWTDPAEYASLGKTSAASVVTTAQNLFDQVYSYMTGTQEDGTPAQTSVKSSGNLYDANRELEKVGGLTLLNGMTSSGNLYDANQSLGDGGGLTVLNGMKNSGNVYDANQSLGDGGGLTILNGMKKIFEDAKNSFGNGATQAVNAYDNPDYSFHAGYGDEGLNTNVYQTAGDQTALPYVAGAGALALVGPAIATAAQNAPGVYQRGKAVYDFSRRAGATELNAFTAAGVTTGIPVSTAVSLNKAAGYIAQKAPEVGQAALGYGAAAVPAAGALTAVNAAQDYSYNSNSPDYSNSAADDAMWNEYLNN